MKEINHQRGPNSLLLQGNMVFFIAVRYFKQQVYILSILQLLCLVISGLFTVLNSPSQSRHIPYQKLKQQLCLYLCEPLQCSDLGLCKIKSKNLLLT